MPHLVLAPEEERARLVLNALKRHRGLSDQRIAELAGYESLKAVHNRRTGVTKIGLGDIGRLAGALAVDSSVFFMQPDDAIRWVLDHPNMATVTQLTRREQEIPLSRCTLRSPLRSYRSAA